MPTVEGEKHQRPHCQRTPAQVVHRPRLYSARNSVPLVKLQQYRPIADPTSTSPRHRALGPEARHRGAVNCAYAETMSREADLACTYVRESMGRFQKERRWCDDGLFRCSTHQQTFFSNASRHFSPHFASLLIRRAHRSFRLLLLNPVQARKAGLPACEGRRASHGLQR
jgi:hypothetical protein